MLKTKTHHNKAKAAHKKPAKTHHKKNALNAKAPIATTTKRGYMMQNNNSNVNHKYESAFAQFDHPQFNNNHSATNHQQQQPQQHNQQYATAVQHPSNGVLSNLIQTPLQQMRTAANIKARKMAAQYQDLLDTPVSPQTYRRAKKTVTTYHNFLEKAAGALFNPAKFFSEKKDEEQKKPTTEEKKKDDKKSGGGEKKDGDDKEKTFKDLKDLFEQMKKSPGGDKKDGDDDEEKMEGNVKKMLRHGRVARMAFYALVAASFAWRGIKASADSQELLARKTNTYTQFVQQYLSQNTVKSLTIHNEDFVMAEIINDPGAAVWFDIMNRADFAARLAIDSQRFNLPSLPIQNIFEPAFGTQLESLAQFGIHLLILSSMAGFALSGTASMAKGKNSSSSIMRRLQPSTSLNIKKEENITVRFDDVAGMDEAKQEIVEFVDFLKFPEKYNKLGARLPKGALLSGPPGTGKTLLAKATAGEAGVPFFTVSGSEFQQMYVGVGAKRVRELFKKARQSAPSIVFIDEIDAVAKKRSSKGHGSGEREATLNQLLVEMDGFNTTAPVVVFAATNRVEMLDNALTRAGRFDRKIQMDTPDLKGREQIFKVHLAKVVLSPDLELGDVAKKVAALTPGLVGADIANVVNEAAIFAARRGGKTVDLLDFDKAVDRVVAGLEKKNDLTKEKQRRIVAYHEAGHALAGWFLENTDPLLKVTIVPRTNGALGFAQYLPSETALRQVEHLRDMMAMALGGRAAEHVTFGTVSTGASDDLSRVARIAQQMITRYGMSPTMYNTAYATLNETHSGWQYISQKTHAAIDDEVHQVIAQEFERVCNLLKNKKDLLEKMSEELLKHETLNHDQIVAILGPRPVQSDEYVDYIKAKAEFDEQKAKETPAHVDVTATSKTNESSSQSTTTTTDASQKEEEKKTDAKVEEETKTTPPTEETKKKDDKDDKQ